MDRSTDHWSLHTSMHVLRVEGSSSGWWISDIIHVSGDHRQYLRGTLSCNLYKHCSSHIGAEDKWTPLQPFKVTFVVVVKSNGKKVKKLLGAFLQPKKISYIGTIVIQIEYNYNLTWQIIIWSYLRVMLCLNLCLVCILNGNM